MDLTRLRPEQVDSAFNILATSSEIVFDMRGYPRGTAAAFVNQDVAEREVLRLRVRADPSLLRLEAHLHSGLCRQRFRVSVRVWASR